ncbi:MAG: hypothetical protein K1000chlam2_00295 [Chlamydiae bacterium]|nr:hypothetical protein [Chlamydiota bacterium]
MKIYLVQHGKAVSAEIDPEKPLSPQGREEVERIGRFLGQKSFPLSVIFHSGKARAKETAEILGAHIAPDAPIEEHANLGPNDPIESMAARLQGEDSDCMVVGHLPFLTKLAGFLIAEDENAIVAKFEMGKVVCLEQINHAGFAIDWMIGVNQV